MRDTYRPPLGADNKTYMEALSLTKRYANSPLFANRVIKEGNPDGLPATRLQLVAEKAALVEGLKWQEQTGGLTSNTLIVPDSFKQLPSTKFTLEIIPDIGIDERSLFSRVQSLVPEALRNSQLSFNERLYLMIAPGEGELLESAVRTMDKEMDPRDYLDIVHPGYTQVIVNGPFGRLFLNRAAINKGTYLPLPEEYLARTSMGPLTEILRAVRENEQAAKHYVLFVDDSIPALPKEASIEMQRTRLQRELLEGPVREGLVAAGRFQLPALDDKRAAVIFRDRIQLAMEGQPFPRYDTTL